MGCEHPRDLMGAGLTYSCSVAGGGLYFYVWGEGFLDEMEETFGVSYRDLLTADATTVRDVMLYAVQMRSGGVILGPNWWAFSDWVVTVETAHDAIGGRLVLIGPPSPSSGATPDS